MFNWIECACAWYWAVEGVGAGQRASKSEAPKQQTLSGHDDFVLEAAGGDD